MSTKIYTGLIFKTNDLRKIHKELRKFQKEVIPIVKEKYVSVAVRRAVRNFDLVTLKKKQKPILSFLYQERLDISEEQKKIKQTLQKSLLNKSKENRLYYGTINKDLK